MVVVIYETSYDKFGNGTGSRMNLLRLVRLRSYHQPPTTYADNGIASCFVVLAAIAAIVLYSPTVC